MKGYPNRPDVARECPQCHNLVLLTPKRLYCSKPCERAFHTKLQIERERAKRDKKQAAKECKMCGKKGLERYCHFICKACAALMIQKNIRQVRRDDRREYQFLLENADKINMRQFIRLQVLAEIFGRDLEEWVNSVPRLAHLQARLMEDRRAFDAGENRKGKTRKEIDNLLEVNPPKLRLKVAPCDCAGCRQGRARAFK